MFPEKLQPRQESNFYHWQFFKTHLDITRAFIEKDFEGMNLYQSLNRERTIGKIQVEVEICD